MASGGGQGSGQDNGTTALAQVMREVALGFDSVNKSLKEVSGENDDRIKKLEMDLQRLSDRLEPLLVAFHDKEITKKVDLTAYRVEELEKRVDSWWKWIGGVVAGLVILGISALFQMARLTNTGDE